MIFLAIILTTFMLIIQANARHDTIKEEFEKIKHYELIHFTNLESFVEGNITNTLEFDAFNEHYKLELTLNDNYPSVVHHPQRSPELPPKEAHKPCHYKGRVIEPRDSSNQWVSISLCNNRGVRAFISLPNDELVIHPAQYHFNPSNNPPDGHQLHHQHLIYKHSANFGTSSSTKSKLLQTSTQNIDTRRRLPYNSDNVIELFIFADPHFVDEFKDNYGSNWEEEIADYIQDFVNAASGEYENTNWGYNIGSMSIKWVRLELVESFSGIYRSLSCGKDVDDCRYDKKSGGSAYRRHFRDWAEKNVDQNYDFGAIYSWPGANGAAWTDGICSSSKNYMNGEGDGSASRNRKLLAHELGHNLGMQHDEESECCNDDGSCDDDCKYFCSDGDIMGDSDTNSGWSSCSKKYLRDYFEYRDGLSCLKKTSNSFTISKNGDENSNSGGGNDDDDDDDDNNYNNNDNNDDRYNNNDNNDDDGPNGGGCVEISSLTMNGKRLNGQWKETGKRYNGKHSYKWTKSSYYLYQARDSGKWYWTIGKENGEENWDYGWCSSSDVLDCDGEWEDYDGEDDNCAFRSCGAFEVEFVEECLVDNKYSDAVCVYYNGTESDHVLYKVDQERGCVYNQPTYRYDDEYLHYSKYGSWVINTDGHMHNFGSYMCNDEDLLDCIAGRWEIEVTHNDVESVKIHPTMTVESCGSNLNINDDKHTLNGTMLMMLSIIIVVTVMIMIGIIFIWKKKRTKLTEIVADESEDEVEEVEVDAIIDYDETNTTI